MVPLNRSHRHSMHSKSGFSLVIFRPIKSCLWTGLIVTGWLLLFSVPGQLTASETAYTTRYEEDARWHPDSESLDSKITNLNHEWSLELEVQDHLTFTYYERLQDWKLGHSDGTTYVSLGYQTHRPVINYETETWKMNLSFSYLNVTRKEALYAPVSGDDTNQFLMPGLTGEYSLSDLTFEAGGWLENDFQAFDYYRYSLFIYQVSMAGVGYGLTEKHKFKLNVQHYDRIYPSDYDLAKDEYSALYQFLNPYTAEERFNWKELSLKYKEIHYPDSVLTEWHLFNYLTFLLFDLNHFFTYGLTATNYHTTYRKGLWDYSLIEEDKMEADLIQTVEYAGFTRISSSQFYFSWKYLLEDSLSKNATLKQSVQLKLSYTFE